MVVILNVIFEKQYYVQNAETLDNVNNVEANNVNT